MFATESPRGPRCASAHSSPRSPQHRLVRQIFVALASFFHFGCAICAVTSSRLVDAAISTQSHPGTNCAILIAYLWLNCVLEFDRSSDATHNGLDLGILKRISFAFRLQRSYATTFRRSQLIGHPNNLFRVSSWMLAIRIIETTVPYCTVVSGSLKSASECAHCLMFNRPSHLNDRIAYVIADVIILNHSRCWFDFTPCTCSRT